MERKEGKGRGREGGRGRAENGVEREDRPGGGGYRGRRELGKEVRGVRDGDEEPRGGGGRRAGDGKREREERKGGKGKRNVAKKKNERKKAKEGEAVHTSVKMVKIT